MTASTSRLAYDDCFSAMDEAITDPKGIRFEVIDEAAAIYFRMRCNRARAIDRRDNAMIYEAEDHPLHGRSNYDRLIIKIKIISGKTWVYIEHVALNNIGKIESLSKLEAEETIERDEPIEHVEEPVIEATAPSIRRV